VRRLWESSGLSIALSSTGSARYSFGLFLHSFVPLPGLGLRASPGSVRDTRSITRSAPSNAATARNESALVAATRIGYAGARIG
jgi:hypothetical protein